MHPYEGLFQSEIVKELLVASRIPTVPFEFDCLDRCRVASFTHSRGLGLVMWRATVQALCAGCS